MFQIPGGPQVTLDVSEMEKQAGTFAQANGLTTQTTWNNFANNLTQTQAVQAMQKILLSFKFSAP